MNAHSVLLRHDLTAWEYLHRANNENLQQRHHANRKSCCPGRGNHGGADCRAPRERGRANAPAGYRPRELTAEEQAKGLTLESKEVRNRIARAGLEAAKKAKPAAFFTPENASLVRIGNFEDDLAKLKDCDLIIEAVVENLEIKRGLYEKVEQHRRPGSIVGSNTSGIPIRQLAEGRSDDFKRHFLGVHFFNPPRYLHLVEIIRTEWTKPEVSCFLYGFLDQRLGKGVVPAKDRPNFIANRIGTYGSMVTIKTMLEDGYSIEEVDKITGQAVGRPKSATFRTLDLVGLDVGAHVIKNLYEALPEDEEREVFIAPEFLTQMVGRGILGNKTKGGFYKTTSRRRRQERNLGDRPRHARISSRAEGETACARHGEEYRRLAGAHQGSGLGQGSRGRVSLEDDVAHVSLHREPYSGDCRHDR